MLPSVALGGHLDGSGTAEPPNGDGQHLIGAMGRAVAFVSKDRGDLVVGDAVAGKRQQALPHFRTSRQSGDRVDAHLHLELRHGASSPDNPSQGQVVLTAVEHDLFDEASQQRLAMRIRDTLVTPYLREAAGEADDLVVELLAYGHLCDGFGRRLSGERLFGGAHVV